MPFDIGGGTGCCTPLRIVSKNPLAVEQLDKTQCRNHSTHRVIPTNRMIALEVSGEAVQAEFERKLRLRITCWDYRGDLDRAIHQICRNPMLHGALPFEIADDGLRLKVIEWALPKVSDYRIENRTALTLPKP